MFDSSSAETYRYESRIDVTKYTGGKTEINIETIIIIKIKDIGILSLVGLFVKIINEDIKFNKNIDADVAHIIKIFFFMFSIVVHTYFI